MCGKAGLRASESAALRLEAGIPQHAAAAPSTLMCQANTDVRHMLTMSRYKLSAVQCRKAAECEQEVTQAQDQKLGSTAAPTAHLL